MSRLLQEVIRDTLAAFPGKPCHYWDWDNGSCRLAGTTEEPCSQEGCWCWAKAGEIAAVVQACQARLRPVVTMRATGEPESHHQSAPTSLELDVDIPLCEFLSKYGTARDTFTFAVEQDGRVHLFSGVRPQIDGDRIRFRASAPDPRVGPSD